MVLNGQKTLNLPIFFAESGRYAANPNNQCPTIGGIPGYGRTIRPLPDGTIPPNCLTALRSIISAAYSVGFVRGKTANMVAPKGETPGMPDGKPDFSCYWTGAGGLSDLGTPDFQDWAEALSKERYANDLRDMPTTRCQPNRVVRTIFQSNAQRFLETRGLFVIYAEGYLPRQIYLDGRSHPIGPNPAWLGHSIVRWEGDTLVVDSVGFNDRPWVDSSHSLTEKLHLVEQYRRPDLGHLELEMTAEDAGALKSPWMIKRTYVLDLNDDIMESVCTGKRKGRAAHTPEVELTTCHHFSGIYNDSPRFINFDG